MSRSDIYWTMFEAECSGISLLIISEKSASNPDTATNQRLVSINKRSRSFSLKIVYVVYEIYIFVMHKC